MRPLENSDIFQIEITQRCFLKCGNCTHGVGAFEHPIEMPLEIFERALDSMEGYPGLIGLIGGEPTTHSQFPEICRIFKKKWGEPTPNHGKKPIHDFNKYVNERLFDRTSRRGLWTSLGAGFYRHFEDITDTFGHLCVNDHRNPGLHQALHITRKDMGIDDAKWEILRDQCWVANTWSGSITVHGKGYFCEVSGMLDSLYNGGANGWELEKGWWKRKPKDYGKQLELCEHCGLALPGPAIEGRKDKTILTPLSLEKLSKVNAPFIRRGEYVLYDPSNPKEGLAAIDAENRSIHTKDSYMPCADMRVNPDNDSVLPKKLTAIVTCVGRKDHLKKTLAHNAMCVDELIIVGEFKGDEGIMCEYDLKGANFRVVQSNRYCEGGDAFNKGKMINDALQTIQNPDWILLTDADVFLNPKLKEFVHSHSLNPGVLYGTSRYDLPQGWVQAAVENWNIDLNVTPASGVNSEPNGYFALFNKRARAIRDRWPKVMSESFCSAGGVDSWFLQQWPVGKRIQIAEIPVIHIAHSEHLGENWNGEKRPKTWRQCGMLTGRGYIPTEAIPDGPIKMRLTDTKFGKSAQFEVLGAQFPMDVVKPDGNGGLIFLGEKLAEHLVVAYWYEGS